MATPPNQQPLLKRFGTFIVDLIVGIPKFFVIFYFSGRKSEPHLIKFLRTLCLLFIYALIVGYLVWLAKDYLEFERTISVNRDEVAAVDMPEVVFTFRGDVTIDCRIVDSSKPNQTIDCSTDVQDVTNANVPTMRVSSGQRALKFNTNRKFMTTNSYLGFLVRVPNANVTRVESPLVSVFHPESSPYHPEAKEKLIEPAKEAGEDFFINSIYKFNVYSVSLGQRNDIKLVQTKRTFFIRTWITKLIGYRNDKHSFEYFTSTFQSASSSFYNDTRVGLLFVSMENFVVVEEEQHASSSLFDVLNGIGGLIGFLFPIYFVCFGTDAVGPWGCCHVLCRSRQRKALRNYYINHSYDWKTPQSPFSNLERGEQPQTRDATAAAAAANGTPSSMQTRIKHVIDETVDNVFVPLMIWRKKEVVRGPAPPSSGIPILDELVQRVQYIELFMKDYIVDTDLAEELFKDEDPVADGNNANNAIRPPENTLNPASATAKEK